MAAESADGTPATDPAIVSYLTAASALDAVDGAVGVTNDAPTVFPLGPTVVTFNVIDAALNADAATATVTVEDTVPPIITASFEPQANTDSWNNTDVTVTFQCSDEHSGVSTCEGDQTLTEDGANQSVEGTATDRDGNITTLIVSGINIDKSDPTITITSPDQGAEFLIAEEVVAVWGASDSLSGIASSTGAVESGLPIDTSTQGLSSFTVTATDLAGNTAMVTHDYAMVVPFAVFEAEKGLLVLELGAASDEFELEGDLEVAEASNGIDVLNEAVKVTLDGFNETIPAGSFFRNADDEFEFVGASGGITQVVIEEDGDFRVRVQVWTLGPSSPATRYSSPCASATT